MVGHIHNYDEDGCCAECEFDIDVYLLQRSYKRRLLDWVENKVTQFQLRRYLGK